MTLRDLLDQVELQGPVSLLEITDNGSKILYEGYGCCLSKKAKVYLDREITCSIVTAISVAATKQYCCLTTMVVPLAFILMDYMFFGGGK